MFQSDTLQALLSAAVDGIITIDLQANITSFNPAAERIFGYQASEVIGRNVKCLMPEAYADAHDEYVHQYQHTGERKIIGIGRRVSGLNQAGEIFPIELSVGEIQHQKQASGYIGIIRDIRAAVQAETDAKQNREQLAHVTRLSTMGEMAAGIAHEVNQPLTAIASYAQACRRLLMNPNQDRNQILEVLEKIDAQALRASEVITKLRRFVKKPVGDYEAVDLQTLIHDTLLLARTDTRLLDHPVALAMDDHLPKVMADAVQLQQVLLNLIRNGVDATEASVAHVSHLTQGVQLTVVDYQGTHLEVIVRDWGVGIDEQAQQTLFHPFQTTKSSGMGIGLCVSRSIVQAHGGELWYATPQTGPGAEFHFILPYLTE